MIYTTVSTCIGRVTSPVLIIAVLLVFTGCKNTPTDAGGDESLQSVAGDYLVKEIDGSRVPLIVDLQGAPKNDRCMYVALGGWISLQEDGTFSFSIGEEHLICDGAFAGTVHTTFGSGTYCIVSDSLVFTPSGSDPFLSRPFKGVKEEWGLAIDTFDKSYALVSKAGVRNPYEIRNFKPEGSAR